MYDDDGTELDARFHIEITSASEASLLFESCGGKPRRNTDYNRALTLVLERLGQAQATLLRVELDTAETRDLPAEERLVVIDEAAYEIELRGRDDHGQLRIGLGRGAGRICSKSGSGGNTQRQVRLYLRFPGGQKLTQSWLCGLLERSPRAAPVYSDAAARGDQGQLGGVEDGYFVPGEDDTRARRQQDVVIRPGQKQFRERLIKEYGLRCAVTGCEISEALEAAHISPYRGEDDNHISNGLLLRADIHSLFDASLLAIEPGTMVVHLHARISEGEYSRYGGRRLELEHPERLSEIALESRWRAFLERS